MGSGIWISRDFGRCFKLGNTKSGKVGWDEKYFLCYRLVF
jgi:hypothetical protein